LDLHDVRRAAILYNPVARGLSKRQHLLQRTIGVLREQGIDARLVPTRAPGVAGVQARDLIEGGCDLILAAGGDGTINEVANGMLRTGVPLAILPGGTANVLARELGLPLQIDKAASQVTRLVSQNVTVGSVQVGSGAPRCFVCMAGVGLDAEIISRLNLDFKAFAGKAAYYVTGFSQIFRTLEEFDVIVDGMAHKASFALVSRVRNYGGDLEIARRASILRDDFEVVLFRGTVSARYLRYFVGVALKRVETMPGCTVLRGHTVICNPSADSEINVLTQLDGELAGSLPMRAGLEQGSLNLLVPPEYIQREQNYTAVSAVA
jgi:diacylglycerol kinase (ATP)